MCGIAFSGKSTLARKIAEHTGSKRIAFDELWVEKDKDKPMPKDADGWKYIRKVAQDEVLKSLKAVHQLFMMTTMQKENIVKK